MRLRQAATHPFLLFAMMRDQFELKHIQEIRQKMAAIKQRNPNRPFIDQIGRFWESMEGKILQAQKSAEDDEGAFGKGQYGLEFNMDPQLAKMEKEKNIICGLCSDPVTNPCKSRCRHTFCQDCIDFRIETQREKEATHVSCPTCESDYLLDEFIAQPGRRKKSRAYNRRAAGQRSRHFNSQPFGNDFLGFQPLGENDSSGFLEECDKNPELGMAPSAKTTRVKDIVLEWQRRFPNDKIISELPPQTCTMTCGNIANLHSLHTMGHGRPDPWPDAGAGEDQVSLFLR